MPKLRLKQAARALAAIGLIAFLTACASSNKPKPADLPANVALMGVRQVWTAKVGEVGFPLTVNVQGNTVTLASTDGTLTALDGTTGAQLWRVSVGAKLAAGVGSDGKVTAVVTQNNELIAFESGRELWRKKTDALAYTAPLVAGGRVFLLAADRSVSAFDGTTGQRLWTQQRPGEPLVLQQGGILLPVGDTLVVGQSGRLVGMNPLNGSSRWEALVAISRGTNDVERLVDLVGPASRQDNVVCVRAFQSSLGCVNASNGQVQWSKPSVGATGVSGNDLRVFSVENDGQVVAFKRSNGERDWSIDRLRYRGLSAPLAIGRTVVVGDNTGLVHFMSREDGSALNRISTDGSAIETAPVLAGNTVVVVTRKGSIYGFQPE
jgi:outer membrane assembly lipoprotein YfgL